MNVVVCIKRVPDTEANIQISDDGKGINEQGIEFIVSPYDEIGVEEGLKIKENAGEGEVTVVSLGPDETAATIRRSLGMGADKGVHIKSNATFDDPFSVASNLAKTLKTLDFNVLFFGKQAIDDDFSSVGAITSKLLDIPFVAGITKLEIADGKGVCEREIEGGHEVIEVPLPAAFSANKGLNEPRYPSLKGIMKAKKKPLDEVECETTDPKLELLGLEYPPKRPPGKIVGEGKEAVPELVRLLREEAKII